MNLRAVVPDAAPAAVAAMRADGMPPRVAVASAPGHPAVTAGTMFDLASVTKVVTAAGILALVGDGTIGLEDRAGRFLDRLHPRVADVSVRQLLTHTAGLPSVPELHRMHPEPAELAAALRRLPPVAPAGSAVAYTSLGYQLLGWIARAATGTDLDAFLSAAVLAPCRVRRACFRPPPALRADIAPTGWSVVRKRVLRGEVHDENAWILGGCEGHTGLFADAEDVRRIGEALLDADWLGPARRHVYADLTGGLQPARSALFVRDDPQFGAPATTWSHTGYTGTSLCLVPERGAVVVLLTNRVHPRRGNERIVGARTAFHASIQRELAITTTRSP